MAQVPEVPKVHSAVILRVLPTRHWHAAMRQFAILYDGRFTVPRT